MSVIKISELRPAGSELFQDSESFLNELNEQEMSIVGGAQVVSLNSISIGISLVTFSIVTQVIIIGGGGSGGGSNS